jgi:hypothetical protein
MRSVLGEDPIRPSHPRDDRIVSLSLHHHITGGIGHDVIIDAWWARQLPAPASAEPRHRAGRTAARRGRCPAARHASRMRGEPDRLSNVAGRPGGHYDSGPLIHRQVPPPARPGG